MRPDTSTEQQVLDNALERLKTEGDVWFEAHEVVGHALLVNELQRIAYEVPEPDRGAALRAEAAKRALDETEIDARWQRP